MSLLDPKFKYVPAVATDVQLTWRKFGWRPLDEMPNMRSMDTSKTDKTNSNVCPTIKNLRK